jgi:hypothetical protein
MTSLHAMKKAYKVTSLARVFLGCNVMHKQGPKQLEQAQMSLQGAAAEQLTDRSGRLTSSAPRSHLNQAVHIMNMMLNVVHVTLHNM